MKYQRFLTSAKPIIELLTSEGFKLKSESKSHDKKLSILSRELVFASDKDPKVVVHLYLSLIADMKIQMTNCVISRPDKSGSVSVGHFAMNNYPGQWKLRSSDVKDIKRDNQLIEEQLILFAFILNNDLLKTVRGDEWNPTEFELMV
jgi:hypothetical protein